jgi:hypothetical protein
LSANNSTVLSVSSFGAALQAAGERSRPRTDHLERHGSRDRHRRCLFSKGRDSYQKKRLHHRVGGDQSGTDGDQRRVVILIFSAIVPVKLTHPQRRNSWAALPWALGANTGLASRILETLTQALAIQRARAPDYLRPLMHIASRISVQPADAFERAMVTEYAPGAGIGWHRDRPSYEDTFSSTVSPQFSSLCGRCMV